MHIICPRRSGKSFSLGHRREEGASLDIKRSSSLTWGVDELYMMLTWNVPKLVDLIGCRAFLSLHVHATRNATRNSTRKS